MLPRETSQAASAKPEFGHTRLRNTLRDGVAVKSQCMNV
uniref:Uncharacterized protein n=1 Tax=Anguilla anguilla TaxID=7936 RepID=A0A0E9QXK2_ANGAN